MKAAIILAESALELVPPRLWRHPAVVNDAERREREPSKILLDRSIHHAAMLKLEDGHKRGRPDLIHATLLSIIGSPVYSDGFLDVFVHTFNDRVLHIMPGTRLPKSYPRFRNLLEGRLAGEGDDELIAVHDLSIPNLVRKLVRPDFTVGFSTQGALRRLDELAAGLAKRKRPALVVGGFPHGHFREDTIAAIDDLVRIHEKSLDAHVVASRVAYELEKAVSAENQ